MAWPLGACSVRLLPAARARVGEHAAQRAVVRRALESAELANFTGIAHMPSSSFPHGLYAMESGPMQAAFSGNSTFLREAYDRGRPVQYGQPVNPDTRTDPVNADLIHAANGSIRSHVTGHIH